MKDALQAFRPVVRSLARNRSFTFAAIATLTLGLGANVAVLSATYAILVRPLPFRDAERLTLIRPEAQYTGSNRPTRVSVQSTDLDTWARSTSVLREAAFYANGVVALEGDSGSEILNSATVSAGFFDEMAGPMAAGRGIGRNDDASPMIVISERLALRLFDGAEAAIGRSLLLKPHTYAIVGVARRDFDFPTGQVDVWLPAGFSRAANSACCSFDIIVRLPAGATEEAVGAAAQSLFAAMPSSGRQSSTLRVKANRLVDERVAALKPALLVLSAAAALLLLIACGNVMNLLLARNVAREGEFAVRRSLGAPARALISQLALEGLALSVVAGAFALAVAEGLLKVMGRLASAGSVSLLSGLHIDWTAVGVGFTLATLATIAATILPSFQIIRGAGTPRRLGETGGRSGSARSLQRAMCVLQVALAVTLLTGATVMNRSLLALLDVDMGVGRDHVLTASINLAFAERLEDAEILRRVQHLVQETSSSPGIRAVGAGAAVPPHLARMQVTLRRRGAEIDYRASAVPATPGYFSALQLRLREGRFFTDRDSEDSAPVMVMTEETAARFFGEKPLGQTMSVPRLRNGKMESIEMTLVGVVKNVKYSGLAARSDDVIYVPFTQQPWRSAFLVLRTDQSPERHVASLRRAIARAEPNVVIGDVATLDELVSGQAAEPRFRTVLLSAIALLALGIAGVGLYGMVAYFVSQRTREVGIRLAVGATAQDVVVMIVRETLAIGGVGIVVGLLVAAFAARFLAGLVYGVAPSDPLSFALASTGLLIVIAVAGYIPARRASRLAPVEALRVE